MLHGVDVAHPYQAGWKPADEDQFVFVKATQGTGYINPEHDQAVQRARDKGLLVGHYHFHEPGNPVDQALHFLRHAKAQPGDLLVCDWEGDWKLKRHPSVAEAAEFIAEVKARLPNNKVGLYCNASDWNTTIVKSGDFLWIADARGRATPEANSWAFWQYSITGTIDLNKAIFDTLDQAKTWAATPTATVPRPPRQTYHSYTWGTEYVKWNGQNVSATDATILDTIQNEVAGWWGKIVLMQGGLSTSVAASANTHAGLGAFDVSTKDPATGKYRSLALVNRLAGYFNRSGLLFFVRGYGLGLASILRDTFRDNRHGHVVSWESYDSLHTTAQRQLDEYRRWLRGQADGDGLVGVHPYPGPKDAPLEHWATSPYNPANVVVDQGTYYVNVSSGSWLYGVDANRKTIKTRDRGYEIKAAKRVKRWGRWNVVTSAETFYAADYLSTTKPE